jgi:hypothetical protein
MNAWQVLASAVWISLTAVAVHGQADSISNGTQDFLVNPGNSSAQGQCVQTGNITSCTFQGSAVANISRAVPELTFQATGLNSSLQLVNLGLNEQSSGWWSS